MNKTKTEKRNSCLICKSNIYDIVFSYSIPDQYEKAIGLNNEDYYRKWVRCTKCGFYYSQYSRDPFVLDRIYDVSYRKNESSWRTNTNEEIFKKVINLPENESETKFRVKWIKDNIQVLNSSNLINFVDQPYKMLDIGGGTGVFAYEFQDDKWISHLSYFPFQFLANKR